MKRLAIALIILALPLLACGGTDECALFERNLSAVRVDCSYDSGTTTVAGSCPVTTLIVATWRQAHPCVTGATVSDAGDGKYRVNWTMR